MTQISKNIEKIEGYYHQNLEILHKIQLKLKELVKNIREITYSDIINYILKEDLKGKIYTQIIIWCNYNIRKGNFFIDF
jgi:hypothetical protein